MCGICGTAGFTDEHLLRRMTAVIAHRGPDDDGIFIAPQARVGLGNCRLSIIDLSPAGHMPMSNEDGTIWITQNGEIYNFLALREELQRRGHVFRSRADTEVLIHGYEEWGLDVLPRLNGMFAFGLLDLRPDAGSADRPVLLLARDRFGIKPLYYTAPADRFLFASEIKSILLDKTIPRALNYEALHRYLSFLWAPGPETLFADLHQLAPAHYLAWSHGRHSIHSYWNLKFHPDESLSEQAAIEELRAILHRAVERHLISDVPVGLFLSGGIDSSTLLGLATKISGQGVKAYTIAYRPEDARWEQSADDPKFARVAAQRFGAEYHEIVVEPNIVDLLPKVVWHLDTPVADPAAISTYLICAAASEELKVLLSGQGSDEVFAGYRVHLTHRLAEQVRRLPAPIRNSAGLAVSRLLLASHRSIPGVRPGLILAAHRYLEKLLSSAALPAVERYVANRTYFPDSELFELYSPELRAELAGSVAGDRYFEHFEQVRGEDFINRMLYVDMKTFLPDLNLAYCDKLSSAASVEVRVPFLDQEIVDFMSQVPPRWKLNGLTTKHILKRAVDPLLPASIIRRRKAGFGAPIRKWLREDLREFVDDLLASSSVRQRGYFDPAQLQRLVQEDRDGTRDHAYRIWALLTLEIWVRTFLDPPRFEAPSLSDSPACAMEAAAAGRLQSPSTLP